MGRGKTSKINLSECMKVGSSKTENIPHSSLFPANILPMDAPKFECSALASSILAKSFASDSAIETKGGSELALVSFECMSFECMSFECMSFECMSFSGVVQALDRKSVV